MLSLTHIAGNREPKLSFVQVSPHVCTSILNIIMTYKFQYLHQTLTNPIAFLLEVSSFQRQLLFFYQMQHFWPISCVMNNVIYIFLITDAFRARSLFWLQSFLLNMVNTEIIIQRPQNQCFYLCCGVSIEYW